MTVTTIPERLAAVRSRIEAAARRSGRHPDEITLVAVTKNVETARIMDAVDAGVRDFGENYVSEALAKQLALSSNDAAVRWHFIGHLQRNKVKDVIDRFALIQSIDSLPLARELGARAHQFGHDARILLQVKLDTSLTKFGIGIEDTVLTAREASEIPGIEVVGLMGMAPFFEEAELARSYFRSLRMVYENLPRESRQILSMGMTADFEVAIEEGATMVRIGAAIFGPRATPG